MSGAQARAPLSREASAEAPLVDLLASLRARDYRFTTITPASHARVNRRTENAWAQDLAGVLGWSRPYRPGVLPAGLHDRLHALDLLEPLVGGWRSRVRVSSLADDLYLHSAWPTAGADAVFFGPDSYRFAGVVRAWLGRRSVPPARVVDIGCGAGPGALTVAGRCPEAEVWGVDINRRALDYAAVNAAAAGVGNTRWLVSDLLAELEGRFDLILANPPYLLDPARRRYRHGGGARGEGLSLAIIECALQRLAPGGTLLLYTGVAMTGGCDPFLAVVRARLDREAVAWRYDELDPDVFGEELDSAVYADADRIAAVCLRVRRG